MVASRDRPRQPVRGALRQRWQRLCAKGFVIAQCAIAAGVAWFVAHDLLGHETPFFAPIAAVVCLGTSYAQRLRRVAEVTVGVAVGVLIADLLVLGLGSGPWQLGLIVALAMSVAVLLNSGQLFITQAAVQSIVVATLVPGVDEALTRWLDAVVGGVVALVAATVVPAAPLRRPRAQAAVVVQKIADLLRAAGGVMRDGEVEPAFALLASARDTDHLVTELRDAAGEGLSVVTSSPFRVRHRSDLRRVADLIEPVDKALRSTRVLARRCAVAAHYRRQVPPSYAALCADLADAAEVVVAELAANRIADAARPALLAVAEGTGQVERSEDLSLEVILAQIRSVTADLLEVTGLGPLEATDALPPTRR